MYEFQLDFGNTHAEKFVIDDNDCHHDYDDNYVRFDNNNNNGVHDKTTKIEKTDSY